MIKTQSLATIAIHGGAGTLARPNCTPELEREFRQALRHALIMSMGALERGASATDAVTLAVQLLEDEPLFNAGRGSVLTETGAFELDAAVMEGRTLAAGAVACVSRLSNPVLAAKDLLAEGRHVLMVGPAADTYFLQRGHKAGSQEYFATGHRLTQWRQARQSQSAPLLDHDAQPQPPLQESTKFGTVGAVALDSSGGLAAATSTGGMVNKRPGRVGDSPLIGAGCWADAHAAVSATGTGEAFIRVCAGRTVSAQIEYGGRTLEQATRHVVHQALPLVQGRGGLIAVDAQGRVAMPFNTEGMYRGVIRAGQSACTAIYASDKDEV